MMQKLYNDRMELMKTEYEESVKEITRKHNVELESVKNDWEIRFKRLQKEKIEHEKEMAKEVENARNELVELRMKHESDIISKVKAAVQALEEQHEAAMNKLKAKQKALEKKAGKATDKVKTDYEVQIEQLTKQISQQDQTIKSLQELLENQKIQSEEHGKKSGDKSPRFEMPEIEMKPQMHNFVEKVATVNNFMQQEDEISTVLTGEDVRGARETRDFRDLRDFRPMTAGGRSNGMGGGILAGSNRDIATNTEEEVIQKSSLYDVTTKLVNYYEGNIDSMQERVSKIVSAKNKEIHKLKIANVALTDLVGQYSNALTKLNTLV